MSTFAKQKFLINRRQTVAEDVVNVLTHGVGLLLAVAAFVILLQVAIATGDHYRIASVVLFTVSLMMMYLSSIAFHSARAWPQLKEIFRTLDHASVYWVIAGSYSPLLLVNLRGHWGWTLFVIMWVIAIFGTVFKCLFKDCFPRLSLISYIVMGWMIVLVAKPLFQYVELAGILWLLIGGLCYTVGAFFYAWEGPRFNHAIWHLFTIAGMLCHAVAILYYVVLS